MTQVRKPFKLPTKASESGNGSDLEVIKIESSFLTCSVKFLKYFVVMYYKTSLALQNIPGEKPAPPKRSTFRPKKFFKDLMKKKEEEKAMKERSSVAVTADFHHDAPKKLQHGLQLKESKGHPSSC